MVSYHDLVEKQRTFFKSGGLRCLSKRREVLQKVKQMIEEGAEEITSSIYKDLHRDGGFEVYMISRAIDEALEKLDEWTAPSKLPVSVPLDASTDDLYIVREPLGVVLVIAPWNYPLATSVPFVQALAAGNTIVWKPSELAPHFADTVEKLVKKHFDETVISVVNGGVPETTELLKERFDHIIYTGCPAVAKVVMSAAAKHLTPVTLELGGKNPTVVLDDADLNLAAAKIVGAKLMNCGQICINPDYILTTEETKPKLVSAIKEAFEKKGNLHENAEFARIINQRHFDRLSELVTKTKGKLMWQAAGEPNREEKFLPPRVYEIEKEDELMKDEIFGPVVPIVTIKNLDEAIRFVQDNEKPLAAYIFSKCPDAVRRFVKETWSGGVCVNDVQTHGFASGVPFGGVGNSGMGRINGKYSFDNFTHEKTVLFRAGVGKDIAANKL